LGGTTVEHTIPRSEDVSKANAYDNCLYACRFCNRSRSAKPVWHQGIRLLDPTRDAWGAHFWISGDKLLAVRGDAEAEYTNDAYELNDPRKVVRRRLRRELLTDRLRLLVRLKGEIAELLRLADVIRRRDLRRFGEVLQQIKAIQADSRRALGDLRRYSAIPVDAPLTCHCALPREHSLPEELDRQTVEVPDSAL
jgi:HNH endonuclease